MAHSYISVNNSITERTVCITDSMLYVFIYFFTTILSSRKLSVKENEIYDHYNSELAELHASFIDLKLDEIYKDSKLKSWYFLILGEIELLLNSYGEYIDNNYLNNLQKLKKQYGSPIPVNKIKNLINDVMWLLHQKDRNPSDEFKWMEFSSGKTIL